MAGLTSRYGMRLLEHSLEKIMFCLFFLEAQHRTPLAQSSIAVVFQKLENSCLNFAYLTCGFVLCHKIGKEKNA